MRITIVPKNFFTGIRETEEAEKLLAVTRVIAFGTVVSDKSNLLCLADDLPFCLKQAKQIIPFVNNGTFPLLVKDPTIVFVLN